MLKNNCTVEFCCDGDELCAVLCGEIDHHTAVSTRAEIDRKIDEYRPRRVVLDLGCINFMDSSGLGLVMGRYAHIQALGGELCVRNAGERIKRIFIMAGLDKKIRIETKESGDEV